MGDEAKTAFEGRFGKSPGVEEPYNCTWDDKRTGWNAALDAYHKALAESQAKLNEESVSYGATLHLADHPNAILERLKA